MADTDEDDFFKWKEENSYKKKGRTGLPPKSERLVGVFAHKKKRKKRVDKRRRWSKDKVHIYTRRRELDFMKYSLIVEHWAMAQYELSREELALIYYLYSEPYFSKEGFIEQSRLLTRKTTSLFNKFMDKGVIVEVPRDRNKKKKRSRYKKNIQTIF
jgi:hypothetical protein